MSKPKAPTPPDPAKTAEAQTGTNLATAIANTQMGQVNQVTPDGSLTYTQSGMSSWTDPTSGRTYQLPQYTATTTLSADAQQLRDANNRGQLALANLGADQASRAGDLLSRPMDMSGAPQLSDRNAIQTSQYGANPNAPQYIEQTGDAGLIDSYRTDHSGDRKTYEDALFQRINPQLDKQRENIQRELSARGVRQGSTAYDRAMQEYGQTANDARYGAIRNASEEQARLEGLDQNAAGFTNASRQQTFANEAARIGQNNAVRGQSLSDALALAGRADANENNRFSQQMSLADSLDRQRSQYMQEQFATRNQPINEITALLSGSQVATPQFGISQPAQMPTTDYAGITQQGYQNQFGNYQQQMNQYNATMGGLFDLGASWLGRPPGGVAGGTSGRG